MCISRLKFHIEFNYAVEILSRKSHFLKENIVECIGKMSPIQLRRIQLRSSHKLLNKFLQIFALFSTT